MDEQQNTKMSQIERFLEEMKNADVTFENYKKYFGRVKNYDEIITSQIDLLLDYYSRDVEELKELTGSDAHKMTLQQNMVRAEVYELGRQLNAYTKECFAWKSVQQELYSVVFEKLYDIIDDVDALKVKKSVLEEFKDVEMQKNQLYMDQFQSIIASFKDLMINKIDRADDKLNSTIKMLVETNRQEREKLFEVLDTKGYDMVKVTTDSIEELKLLLEPIISDQEIEETREELHESVQKSSGLVEIQQSTQPPAQIDPDDLEIGGGRHSIEAKLDKEKEKQIDTKSKSLQMDDPDVNDKINVRYNGRLTEMKGGGDFNWGTKSVPIISRKGVMGYYSKGVFYPVKN